MATDRTDRVEDVKDERQLSMPFRDTRPPVSEKQRQAENERQLKATIRRLRGKP